MFQLDLKSRKSIYEQVVDNMKELIIAGVLPPNEKLPSVRELSKMLTVNPNTVQKAYRELEHQSFIYTVAGLGTFVSEPAGILVDQKKFDEIKETCRNAMREFFYLGMSVEQIESIFKELLAERGARK